MAEASTINLKVGTSEVRNILDKAAVQITRLTFLVQERDVLIDDLFRQVQELRAEVSKLARESSAEAHPEPEGDEDGN